MLTTFLSILLIIMVITSFFVGYKLFAKTTYQLNGCETLFFQLSYILIFFRTNFNSEIQELLFFLGIWLLVYLAYYYLLRMIKTKFYIKWEMFIVYIILFIINGLALTFIPMTGWDILEYAFITIIFDGTVLIYLLLINLITLIIRKVKRINIKKYDLILNKEIIVSIIVLIAFLPFICGINYESKQRIKFKDKENTSQIIGLDYLNKKYGDGDFKIIDTKCTFFEYAEDCTLKVSSKYTKGEFEIEVDMNNKKVYADRFIFEYYSSLYNKNIKNVPDLEILLEQIIADKTATQDYKLNVWNVDFDYQSYKNIYLNDIPSPENIKEFIALELNEVMIYKKFNENEIDEFCQFIIDIYEKINYQMPRLNFIFNYDNPFQISKEYKTGGYLNNAGDYWYEIYVNPTPIHVKK